MPAPTADTIRRMLQSRPPLIPHDGERPNEGQRNRTGSPMATVDDAQRFPTSFPQVVGFDAEYRREDGPAYPP